eukprot:CAMPEP_0117555414 /NCGR_PEP_ID=MMETSP0784-20121206/51262_1 /TAXON_ID=39447 /ORGANISM="" /LENGTH=68 /DNA_ID=CAMNT_0005352619 /DNA_START=43 /DNA_END=246 /DNA_ORIENTATION=-
MSVPPTAPATPHLVMGSGDFFMLSKNLSTPGLASRPPGTCARPELDCGTYGSMKGRLLILVHNTRDAQ